MSFASKIEREEKQKGGDNKISVELNRRGSE
jgi:hypothetical protein